MGAGLLYGYKGFHYSVLLNIRRKSASDYLLVIYVDGSCLGNQNVDSETVAAWGVVVVEGDSKLGRGTGEIIHEFCGRVNKKFLSVC